MQSRLKDMFTAIIGRTFDDRSVHQILFCGQRVPAGPPHQILYFVRNRDRPDCPPQSTIVHPLLLIIHGMAFNFQESVTGLGGINTIACERPKQIVLCLTL